MPNESNLYNARSKKWPGFFCAQTTKKPLYFLSILKKHVTNVTKHLKYLKIKT